jgi:hypothetical protein
MMKPMMSSQTTGARNQLARLLHSLRCICRSGLPAGPLLDRLKSALVEAGKLGRMITIVPRPGFTVAVPKISFAIDKQIICIPDACEPRPALPRRGCRRGRYNARDYLRSDSPQSLESAVAVMEIDNQGRAS